MSGNQWKTVKKDAPKKKTSSSSSATTTTGGGAGSSNFGGSRLPQAHHAPQTSINGVVTVTDTCYPGTRALHHVILRNKVAAQYPNAKIEVSETEGKKDSNGKDTVQITYKVTGSNAQAAATALRNRHQKKHEFYIDDSDVGDHVHQRAQTAPEKLQLCITFARRPDGSKIIASTLMIDGDSMDWSPPKVEEQIKHLLGVGNQVQQFRGATSTTGGRGASVAGGSRHYDPTEDDHQIVTGGRGDRSHLNSVEYSTELSKADHLPPKDALKYLGHLVDRKRNSGGTEDALAWLAFLYEVEVHGVLAELAEYEIQGVRLRMSAHIKNVAVIKIDLSTGIRPFTERRPSVMIEDDVLLHYQTSNRVSGIFRAPIFNVLSDQVWIHTDNLRPADEKTSRTFDANSQARLLQGHIADGTLFKVCFDPAPYTNRCKMLGNSVAKNYMAHNFCMRKDPGVDIPNLEAVVNQTAKERYGSTRQAPARASRGGRMVGGPQKSTDPHEGLEEKQRYASNAILHAPSEVRKIFIEGPCGTGKTHTVCHSVVQLLKDDPNSRVLMLSPSHSASDVTGVRLVHMLNEAGFALDKKTIIRLYPRGRSPLRCPEALWPLTNFPGHEEGRGKAFSDVTYADRFEMDFIKEPGYLTHRVVISNLGSVGQIFRACREDKAFKPFTHVFIDEVAQSAYAETLNGLSQHCNNESVRFVFSGDEQQIGPRCFADCAKEWLKRSACRWLPNSAVKIRLDTSYRQVPALANLQSLLFYRGSLKAANDLAKAGLDDWGGHHGNPQPLRFIHVGADPQIVKSSFCNKAEANVIINCILSLRGELDVQLSDMIVFTQFKEQRRHLTSQFAMRGCKEVQVREIEEFHGDEKDVVIMSLVQNDEDENAFDRKQLNTAIGRTSKLCLIVGNGEMVEDSKEPKWRELISELKNQRAVDGYDYEEDQFDDKLWKPQPAKALVDKIKEFQPGKGRKQELDERFQRISKEDVLANSLNYFVGTVSGSKDWNQRSAMSVRHRHVSGNDVVLDDDETSGLRKDYIFDGDLVAVQIDDRVTRWQQGAVPRGPTKVVAYDQPDVYCQINPDSETVTIEEFSECIPGILSWAAGRPITPTGKVVAILSQPELPPLVGSVVVNGNKPPEFQPMHRRFPRLKLERNTAPRQLQMGDIIVVTLVRSLDQEPQYRFLNHAPSPFALEEILKMKPPTIPNAASRVSELPPLLQDASGPHEAIAFRTSQCAFSVWQEGDRWWVGVYIPPIGDVFAQNPDLEREAHSRGSGLWQSPIADFCEKKRLPLFSSATDYSRMFYRAAEAGETCNAIRIKFPAIQIVEGQIVTCTDGDKLLKSARVQACQVRPRLSTDAPQDRANLGNLALHLREDRSYITSNPLEALKADNDNEVMAELDIWANYVSGVVLARTIPQNSLLARQDPSCEYLNHQGVHKKVIEKQEYWVPATSPITRGYHAGSGFSVFANVTKPCEKYADVLTQRLLLIACKYRTGMPATRDEIKFVESIKKHVAWLNTVPLVYGEIIKEEPQQ